MEFELGFHGHVGPCRICRLCSDIFLDEYIYIYICVYICLQLILVMQVAVDCFCIYSVLVLFLWLVSDFG